MTAVLVGRVGGLAMAMGVSAVIATAGAATAWASPSEDRPGVSQKDSTGHAARAATGRASQSRHTRVETTSRDSEARPAVGVSARVVRSAATVPAVGRRPAADITVPAPVAQSSTATVASARFGDPRGRLVTIYKGTHFAIPNRWAVWVEKVTGDATFIPNSAYDLKDSDQYDWNKLAGITFTPWRPERNASIVVWRYNLNTREYEVGPFWDVDFAYVFPTDDEVISVPVGQTFGYAVDYDGITITYGDKTVFKPTPQGLSPNFLTSARITGWFGGNRVAPRTVSYYLNMR